MIQINYKLIIAIKKSEYCWDLWRDRSSYELCVGSSGLESLSSATAAASCENPSERS